MYEWWGALDVIRQVLYIIPIPSTILLVLQTVLLLFGMGHGGDTDSGDGGGHDFGGHMDADHDVSGFDHDCGGLDHDHGGFVHESAHSGDSEFDSGLQILTMRGLVAFLSICGWVGIALLDLGLLSLLAIPIAVAAGFGAMLLVAFLIRASMNLQQSGNLELRNAVGLVGEVYLPIPENGKGKVTLVVQERFMEFDAVSDSRALKTGEQVRVVALTESNVLIVVPLKA